MRSTALRCILVVAPLAACAGEERPPLYEGDADLLLGHGPIVAPATAPLEGHFLVAPMRQKLSYLLDATGRELHRWRSDYFPGSGVRLLDDGSILRCCRDPKFAKLRSGGQGGRIQRIGWDGELLWDFAFGADGNVQHHDATLMPNGNVLFIAWERKTREEALARGRDPALPPDGEFWPDWIVEVRPVGADGGEIVWEWHAWDHLIQDYDPARTGYGRIAENPQRIDINGDRAHREAIAGDAADRAAQMAALGYTGAGDPPAAGAAAPAEESALDGDWLHTNSVDYHPRLDLIVLSVMRFHEAWVIDHSTSTAEAAGSVGGRHGRGGDLLYRWGNPSAHKAGRAEERIFFVQHHVQWIPDGLPGAGNFLCFNNGVGRPDGNYSSIEEWRMPIGADGRIGVGPERPSWRWTAPRREDFFAPLLSGVQRLPNGSTLITEGTSGRLLEVASDGTLLLEWRRQTPAEAPEAGAEPRRRASMRSQFRAFKIPPDHPGLARLGP